MKKQEPCDCTVRCGDDPWIALGKAKPCASLLRDLAEERERKDLVAWLRSQTVERAKCLRIAELLTRPHL